MTCSDSSNNANVFDLLLAELLSCPKILKNSDVAFSRGFDVRVDTNRRTLLHRSEKEWVGVGASCKGCDESIIDVSMSVRQETLFAGR